ncbi:MAG: hypothetical protein E6041_05255 [Escherichia coli]|uniref:hypothetical protein n=1 Tax=Negativicoccus succinicivorans TaxID=620903 RepID=UPI00290FD9B8|nr:hypothetical protein [Negativicoccus succinicivorans]MDU5530526.1 hypothetical protein [Negativicoccus succinicivorans]MDU5591245.1 hypothetical protein [Escherichia coli]
MTEIKNASAATDANKTTHQNYSIEKLINQKVLGKSIASELAAFEAVGLHLLNFYDENDVLDEQAIKYIHGQGEGMLKVVDNMKVLIAKLIRAEAGNNAHV